MIRLVLLLVLVSLVAGCSGGPSPARRTGPADSAPSAATAAGSAVRSYVALGDSYTSAPYVYLTDVARGCLRSDHDYPALVAKALRVRRFADVSCAGATTWDVTHRQPTLPERDLSVPPQLRAVRPGTDLVTVGLGGNDFGIFDRLAACASSCLPGSVSTQVRGSIAALRPRLVATLRLVQRRAPGATVLLVGYPKIGPDRGGCPGLPGVTPATLALLNRLNRGLDLVMRQAARAARVGFVDVYRASRGHDVCAPDPWVNGVHTDTSRALALHPFAVEQRAVARLVVGQVSR
ncbi:MAG TPA: SGNH/GDSL hydrolase family protein [Marmoricola sp.]|nr:SGNH/GDSL hydrolase family protein [Marmoricola sp.]